MSYGVTPAGFVLKTAQNCHEEMAADLVSKFGNVRTDSQSKFGMLLDFFSSKFGDLWAVAQDVYLSKPITAEGVALDDIVFWSGLSRLSATKSGLYVVMYGEDGTEIPVNTTVRGLLTGNQFVLDSTSSMNISAASIGHCVIDFTFVSGADYVIRIDKAVSINAADLESVINLMVNSINDISAVVTASNLGNGQMGLLSKDFTNTTISVTVGENMEVSKFGTAMPFIAQEFGPVAAPVGDLTKIITSVQGLDECYNFTSASLGRYEETDTELRDRFLKVRSALGYATLDSIVNRIKEEVANVTDCFGYENTSDVTDADGIPPKSIMIVVDCPASAEQAVADKIWKTKAGGIGTHGAVSKTVTDSKGKSHVVKLSKVLTKYAHVNVVVTKSTETAFPVDGLSQIQQAILAHGQSFVIGNDMIHQSFYKPIYGVSGIASAVVQISVTNNSDDEPVYVSESIAIGKTTKVDFDLSRIHVSF